MSERRKRIMVQQRPTQTVELSPVDPGASPRVCVVGLGYVGTPLAVAFAKHGVETAGFDVNAERISSLASGTDANGELSPKDLSNDHLTFSADPAVISQANFIVVAVPTPVTAAKQPDLSILEAATRTVGTNLSAGSVVVFESTVYPGVTEEACVPILEQASGLAYQKDFAVGYSPERINPGDTEHTIDKVVKVVAGSNPEATERIASVYRRVCPAGVHIAPSIQVAEAAKVIENVQRDLNIALVNELSVIFHRLGIDTQAVLAAAGTKWNFHHYRPGLVGGHCIGVDPYYLLHLAQERGHHPELIAAGRRVNDGMARHVALLLVQSLSRAGKAIQGARVLILGLAFKENVADTRNSKIFNVAEELQQFGATVLAHDPLVAAATINGLPNLGSLEDQKSFDAIILAVPHRDFLALDVAAYKARLAPAGVLFDLKGVMDREDFEKHQIEYLRL